MAFAKVFLKNPRTGQMREAPIGYSWTMFFFGFFPPIFRGDWVAALILILLSCVLLFLPALVLSFFYNKMYLRRMINEGFEATGGTADLAVIERKVGFAIPRISA